MPAMQHPFTIILWRQRPLTAMMAEASLCISNNPGGVRHNVRE
ncbi:hypothetical protein [Enterobacter roggenkampii]